jgi:phospholipid/cholesterol/gamma-HCH transport system substrate-binding protein
MANRKIDNVKLGIFVLIGLVALSFSLYKVGKGSSLFRKNFTLKAQFKNVSGLMIGNNIRYVGIQVGTIKKIELVNDTLIEVEMNIDEKMKNFIHKSDHVDIGTDGLVGNKLLNISKGKTRSELVSDGDLLGVSEALNTDEMMLVLSRTNTNIALITEDLKSTVQRLNNSTALWTLLNDKAIPDNMIASLKNIRNATVRADDMVAEFQTVVRDVKNGKGSIGILLKDTAIAYNMNQAVDRIKLIGDNANALVLDFNGMSQNIKSDLNNSKGAYHAILKDTMLVFKLNNSMNNIELGTDGFNQNMEALKHNFLFRGYFRRLEKKKKKEQEQMQMKKVEVVEKG